MKRFVTGLMPYIETVAVLNYESDNFKITFEKLHREQIGPRLNSEDYFVVIESETIEEAQKIFSHIIDIICVIGRQSDPIELVDDYIAEEKVPNNGWGTMEISEAIEIYFKLKDNSEILYAFALIRQSLRLHSNEIVDLNPQYFPYVQDSTLYSDHIRFGYAVVMAYEAIVQIELAPKGKIIEEARTELLQKLRKKNIDGSREHIWLVRGDETLLEKSYLKRIGPKAEWSTDVVRDCYVELINAIIFARDLRSKIFLHQIDDLAKLCTVHEVWNVQMLARYLLLQSIGRN